MVIDYSIIVPVYKNELNINELLARAEKMSREYSDANIKLEFVFVVDGSPDFSHRNLSESLPKTDVKFQVFRLSKNVGSAMAIKYGLRRANGKYLAIMAADLQEPESLYLAFYKEITSGGHELVFGTRNSRGDSLAIRVNSRAYWYMWSLMLGKKIHSTGYDVFCITSRLGDLLAGHSEHNTALIASILDLGTPYSVIPYDRKQRVNGKSSWTLKKKLELISDSFYGFSNIPLRVMNAVGVGGVISTTSFGFIVILGKLNGKIEDPGYASVITTILFSTSVILVALSISSNYVWRIYKNTTGRAIYDVIEERSNQE